MSFFTSSSEVVGRLKLFGAAVMGFALVAFGASEWLVRSKIVAQDDFRTHVSLFTQSTEPDAIFGDSHAARGLVPDKGMVNLAYPSEGIEQMDWKIRTYYMDKEPGRVIIQADPHLFAPYRLARGIGDYAGQFEEAGNSPGWWPQILVSRYRSNLMNYWSSYIRSGGNLRSRIEVLKNGALLSPGNLAKLEPRLRLFRARQRIETHKIYPRGNISNVFQTYRETLDFLSSHGATICMLTYPLSPDYIDALENRQSKTEKRDRQTVLRFFASEAKRIGARYVDLQQKFTDRNDFRDVDHLNGKAAVRYSPEIIKQCFS